MLHIFSDLPLLSPLAPQFGLEGPINARRATTILDDYFPSFFETALQRKESDLFNHKSQKYNEIKILK